jgi:hypothetical protein
MRSASEKKRTDYLTFREASGEFPVAIRTLKLWASRGLLKRYRMAGLRDTLICREELERVMEPQPIGA